MGKKFKITEDQLKRLVENKSKIQEQNEGYMDEEIDGPSKEEYFAKHGDDNMGWTGSSNKTYGDLPDGDYDDLSYDDFDTLHDEHPDFYKHYSSSMGPEHARGMFRTYKEKHGPLRMKKRKHVDDFDPHYDRDQEINYGIDDDDMMNESIKKIKSQFKRFL